MDDENRNIPLRKPLHLFAERYQRAQTSILGVIKVPGNDEKIGFDADGVVDNPLQGAQSRRLQTISQSRPGPSDTSKPAIQMKVRRMDESQRLHIALLGCMTAKSGPERGIIRGQTYKSPN